MNQRFLSVQPAARFLRALALAVPLSATGGAAANASYWNLFNIEGESTVSAEIVTYAAFIDMLNDTNRTGNFNPGGAADNVVGTGSDGTTYWNLFNAEGESDLSSVIVTYATLTDMLNDTNRTGNFNPGGAADNVVGTGAGILSRPPVSVAEPGTLAVLASGLAALGLARRRRRR